MRDLSNKNIVHIKKDDIEYIQFRKLLEYDNIIKHAYVLGTNLNFRTMGLNKQKISEEDFNKAVLSYKKICDALDENYINVVKTNQEHTKNIGIVENKINLNSMDINLEKYYNTDGLITDKSNLILSTTNADCILLLFFDPIKKVIANVHSGWKGTVQRISIKAVEKMEKEFGCNKKDIICCICPSIRKCHFEVSEDVKVIFEEEFKDLNISNSKEIMEKQENKEKWNIDTVLINKILLKEKGLKEENIIDSGICSVCNSDLIHSYRVEKDGYGLSTALIVLK